MNRSPLRLAALLLAGLLYVAATPTASAQSAVDCPNTVRAVNGCDDAPARAAQDVTPVASGKSAAVQRRGGLGFYTTRAAFDAANPGTTLEDFEDIAAPHGQSCTSTSPADASTNNSCISTGDIEPGLIVVANGSGGETDALIGWGPGVVNGSVTLGANYFSHHTGLRGSTQA